MLRPKRPAFLRTSACSASLRYLSISFMVFVLFVFTVVSPFLLPLLLLLLHFFVKLLDLLPDLLPVFRMRIQI
jgi:hypothetical protein